MMRRRSVMRNSWRCSGMQKLTVMMARRLLTVSRCWLTVMGSVMWSLIRSHEWRLTRRRVRRVRIRMHASVSSCCSSSRCMRRIMWRLIRNLRQRVKHVMWKILGYSLNRLLIDNDTRSRVIRCSGSNRTTRCAWCCLARNGITEMFLKPGEQIADSDEQLIPEFKAFG